MKRGQVAIFIIMAIFVVAALGLFFLLRGETSGSEVGGEAGRVYNFVKACADEGNEELLYDIGMKGGYLDSPSGFISYGIPVYRDGDRTIVPDVSEVESEVAKGFNEKMIDCVGDFSEFPDLDIVTGEPNSLVEISDEEIVFKVNFPMTVVDGSRKNSFEEFGEVRVETRMGLMREIAFEVVETESVDRICLTCLAEIAEKNGVKIDLVDYDEDTVFVIISHEELNGEVFEFSFAMVR